MKKFKETVKNIFIAALSASAVYAAERGKDIFKAALADVHSEDIERFETGFTEFMNSRKKAVSELVENNSEVFEADGNVVIPRKSFSKILDMFDIDIDEIGMGKITRFDSTYNRIITLTPKTKTAHLSSKCYHLRAACPENKLLSPTIPKGYMLCPDCCGEFIANTESKEDKA